MKASPLYIQTIQACSHNREVWLRGSTRSGKSFVLAQVASLWLLNGNVGAHTIRNGVLSVVRKTMPALTVSLMRDFTACCDALNFSPARTYNTFTYQGRVVEFFSIDDPSKVKSRKRDILLINELPELAHTDYLELTARTKYFTLADFNPTWGSWVQDAEKTKCVIPSRWQDNPFLSSEEVAAIEALRNTSLWSELGEGLYSPPSGLVYTHWELYDTLPDDIGMFTNPSGGLDFGINDPTAGIAVWIKDKTIYAKELFYGSNLTTEQIADLLSQHADIVFYHDHEPRTAQELRSYGVHNITRATKGKNSITSGIQAIKTRRLFIHKDSHNLINELRSYCFEASSNVPKDKDNHLLDALRFVINSKGLTFIPKPITINAYTNDFRY